MRGIQRSGRLSYSHGVVTGGGVGSESVSTAQGAELPAERVLKKRKASQSNFLLTLLLFHT